LNIDTSLLHHVIQLRTPWLDDVMILASALAAGGFLWIVLALIASLYPRYRADAWRLLLTIGFSLLVSDYVLKPMFDRPRPFTAIAELQVIDGKPASSSMPSGHAARAIAASIAATRMMPAAGWLLWPFAALVMASRVYIGVHWPSDVLVGAVVGLGCAWFVLGGRNTTVAPPRSSAIYS
jgi:undecaprenyl-diphosphatase